MSSTSLKPIYILNGPNLNLLGSREVDIYGATTLSDIRASTLGELETLGLSGEFRQTNQEGELVDWIQEAGQQASGVLLNAAAYTHTSIAVHDAVAAIAVPVIELHLSNVFAREDYRHHSYISDVAAGVICGFGANSYILAARAIHEILTNKQ
jgi:3-dehydroquinate dehydratase-2